MTPRRATFYLSGRFIGSCELPFEPVRFCDKPTSHHYIDPDDGEIWATVEISGSEWSSWRLPKLANRNPANANWPRGLQLSWLFGPSFYDNPSNLLVLPQPILELEFACHLYNHERGI